MRSLSVGPSGRQDVNADAEEAAAKHIAGVPVARLGMGDDFFQLGRLKHRFGSLHHTP